MQFYEKSSKKHLFSKILKFLIVGYTYFSLVYLNNASICEVFFEKIIILYHNGQRYSFHFSKAKNLFYLKWFVLLGIEVRLDMVGKNACYGSTKRRVFERL